VGITGQNTHRPCAPLPNPWPITSNAGRNVSAVAMAQAMPMAPTGPRPLVGPRLLSSRQSRPRMTVLPEATIGSTARRQATFIAS